MTKERRLGTGRIPIGRWLIAGVLLLIASAAGAEPLRIAYTSIAAIQTILEEISATRPLPSGITPQRFADSRFIRELVASGFVDKLYKGR